MTDRPEELIGLTSMIRIRRVEERLSELFTQGKIPGFIQVYAWSAGGRTT